MSGTVRGVALKPGISANNRKYTKENIGRAYERLRARIADPNGSPVVMRTHHGAGDDSTRVVGQVKAVSLDEDGTLRYSADFADTEHAQTIRQLAKPDLDSGKPMLAHVSIYGGWTTEPTTETLEDGRKVTTAPDLEIDCIDFTTRPGVAAASASAETAAGRWAISESTSDAELSITEGATLEVVEAVNLKPYGDVQYADPGYQGDKKKRYPLDSEAHAKSAWSFINQKDNAALYTATQLKRIKGRITAALKKYGVDVTSESLDNLATESGFVPLAETQLSECMGCISDATGTAGFSISAYNGPLTVTVSAYNGVEPADLSAVAMAAMAAACDAIHALDPDDDGDIDTGVSDAAPPDLTGGDQMETAAPTDPATAVAETEAAATAPADDTKEHVMTDATAATEVAAPEIDYAKLAEAVVAAQAKASETAAAKAVEETAKAETATATEAQLRETTAEALKAAARELLMEGGLSATRKGAGLQEQTSAEPTTAELWEKRGEIFLGVAQDNARRFGTARV